MKKTVPSIILAVAVFILIHGCAPRRTPYDDLYSYLREVPDSLDWSVLEGRTIVIDPGHGGTFDGVIGIDSLREADANLGVALYLWGLLKEAGANAHLTRTTDRDFLPPGSTELRDDLEARVGKANEWHPEVFISIHHNANIALDRNKNSVEVYYRSDDPAASLELARDIHIHLARNLGIEESDIKPGNYYVLRNSAAMASILGEASYLSHPVVEERLKLSNKQRLEAEAYFLGLLSYFSRGVPVIERISPMSDTLNVATDITFSVYQGAGVPLDPASAIMTVNGRKRIPLFEPTRRTVRYSLDPNTGNGTYEIRCRIRSIRGATGSSRPFTIFINRPAAYILPLPASREAENRLSVGVRVLDELGQPVADGMRAIARSQKTGHTFKGTCRQGTFQFEIIEDLAGGDFVIELPGTRETIRFNIEAERAILPFIVVDHDTGRRIAFPLASSPLAGTDEETLGGDSQGRLLIPRPDERDSFIVAANGYRPALVLLEGEIDKLEKHIIRLQPIFKGVLKGKRIALDPAGGGADHGGRGKHELRGASVNLQVSQLLRDLLERCGAKVTLTRHGEEILSLQERIAHANRFHPDLAISIHHGPQSEHSETDCFILHYPSSKQGKALAERLSVRFAGLPPCGEFTVQESAGLFLQQTSCPACEIRCGTVEEESMETVFSNPRYVYLESERILAAIMQHFASDTLRCINQRIVIVSNGLPVEGAAVCIDQALTMFTDRNGIAHFTCIDPGMHLVTYETPGDNPNFIVQELGTDETTETTIEVSNYH